MYRNLYDPLLEGLEAGLEKAIAEHPSPAERLIASRAYIKSILDQLKGLLFDHPFPAQADEIEFFKTIKPSVYAYKIFEEEFYKLTIYQPAGTNEMITVYLNEELKQVGRFFSLNAFHYQYFKLGATELDSLCFLRGAQGTSIPMSKHRIQPPIFLQHWIICLRGSSPLSGFKTILLTGLPVLPIPIFNIVSNVQEKLQA